MWINYLNMYPWIAFSILLDFINHKSDLTSSFLFSFLFSSFLVFDSYRLLVVVVVVFLVVFFVTDVISWGESQSWKTSVVAIMPWIKIALTILTLCLEQRKNKVQESARAPLDFAVRNPSLRNTFTVDSCLSNVYL